MNSKQRKRILGAMAPRGDKNPVLKPGSQQTITANDPRRPSRTGHIESAYVFGRRYDANRIEVFGAMARVSLIDLGAELKEKKESQ